MDLYLNCISYIRSCASKEHQLEDEGLLWVMPQFDCLRLLNMHTVLSTCWMVVWFWTLHPEPILTCLPAVTGPDFFMISYAPPTLLPPYDYSTSSPLWSLLLTQFPSWLLLPWLFPQGLDLPLNYCCFHLSSWCCRCLDPIFNHCCFWLSAGLCCHLCSCYCQCLHALANHYCFRQAANLFTSPDLDQEPLQLQSLFHLWHFRGTGAGDIREAFSSACPYTRYFSLPF